MNSQLKRDVPISEHSFPRRYTLQLELRNNPYFEAQFQNLSQDAAEIMINPALTLRETQYHLALNIYAKNCVQGHSY